MNEQEVLEKIKNFVLQKIPPDDIHGFGHTKRVYQICIEIGQKLGADLFILKTAALLHDIGRFSDQHKLKNRNHAEISAEIASIILKTKDFQFNEKQFENIIHCIQSHSFSNRVSPKTLEAHILSDADKLDALGAIGLYRTIGYTTRMNGNLQDVIEHLESKILKLKSKLFLDISKEYAQERCVILDQFYEEVKKELKLERS